MNDWEEKLKAWWYGEERTYEQAVYFIAQERAKAIDELVDKAIYRSNDDPTYGTFVKLSDLEAIADRMKK